MSDGEIAGIWLLFILGLALTVACITNNSTNKAWERWLVQQGVAEYTVDESGNPEWRMKEVSDE